MNFFKTIVFGLLVFLTALPVFGFEDGIDRFGADINGVRHVSAIEAAEILKNYPTVKVLDVRTGIEFNRGHISDATNINYYSFSFREQLAKLDKNITWLVHCRTGVRSGKSVPIMQSLGFKSIVHLDGGTSAWTKNKLPLIKN